jgi:hypothetical protein
MVANTLPPIRGNHEVHVVTLASVPSHERPDDPLVIRMREHGHEFVAARLGRDARGHAGASKEEAEQTETESHRSILCG